MDGLTGWEYGGTMSFSYPPGLGPLLEELEAFGERNDASVKERPARMLNITPDTGAFLSVLVRTQGARNILEIGTSNGYSTLWLASAAASVEGEVTTLDVNPAKTALARQNLQRAGLEGVVRLHTGDAGEFLAQGPVGRWDLIFLDSERSEYPGWWLDLWRALRPHGLLVVDNALSHAAELEPFLKLVQEEPSASHVLVPVGKGELVVLKEKARAS